MDSVKVLAISVQALLTAGVHPYTLDKTRKYVWSLSLTAQREPADQVHPPLASCRCIKPIAGLILTFFLLSLVLTAPIRVIAVAVSNSVCCCLEITMHTHQPCRHALN